MDVEVNRLSVFRLAEIAVLVFCLVMSAVKVYGFGASEQTGQILLSMGTDVVGIVMASVLFSSLAVNRSPVKRDELFMMLFVIGALTLYFNLSSWFVEGRSDLWALQLAERYAKNVLLLLMALLFWYYLCMCIEVPIRAYRRGTYLVVVTFLIGLLLLVVNLFTDCLFSVGEDGVYTRGGYLFFLYGLFFFMLAVGVYKILVYSGDLRESVVAITYLAATLLMIVIQYFRCGLSLVYMSPVLVLIFVYINFYIIHKEKSLKREYEIQAERTQAMVTQLQPHFLFNALTSIMAIKGNPPETQDAICEFSKYLRENLKSAEMNHPIPFRAEVDHVESYLILEKLRFKDKLEYELNINDNMFPIPPLVLQLVAENAIRHGITMNPGGGKIVIASRKVAKGHLIVVVDDGVGFDMNAPANDRHPHRGLEYCRTRLKEDVDGRMVVNSEPGKGTRVVIFIPFQNAKQDQ